MTLLSLPHGIRAMRKGSHVQHRGVEVNHVAVVLCGSAARERTAGDGGRQIIEIYLKGDLISTSALLTGVAQDDIVATQSGEIAVVSIEALNAAALSHPGVARALWMATAISAMIVDRWMIKIGRRDGPARLAYILCELAFRTQAIAENRPVLLPVIDRHDVQFDLPLTLVQVADCIGMTNEHLSRCMRMLEDSGMVARIGALRRTIVIQDWQKLSKAGEFSPEHLYL